MTIALSIFATVSLVDNLSTYYTKCLKSAAQFPICTESSNFYFRNQSCIECTGLLQGSALQNTFPFGLAISLTAVLVCNCRFVYFRCYWDGCITYLYK